MAAATRQEVGPRKRRYAARAAGGLQNFTGINAPYEPPVAPEIAIDTTGLPPGEAADRIVAYLRERGYV